MGSESSDPFRPFFIAAHVGEAAAPRIDEALIRTKFGDTLFPPVTITVEPVQAAGTWWAEVEADGEESGDEYFEPWRQLIAWFDRTPELLGAVFVRIGDSQALGRVPKANYPAGTLLTGSGLPRLAVALTQRESIVGLFGQSVQT